MRVKKADNSMNLIILNMQFVIRIFDKNSSESHNRILFLDTI